MQIETATLLAVMAAPIATLALVVAFAVAMMARRGRRAIEGATRRLEAQEPMVRAQLTSARDSLERVGAATSSLRAQGTTMDGDVAGLTARLVDQRATIERLNSGRLGPAVRALQMASALARVALLWRTPAR